MSCTEMECPVSVVSGVSCVELSGAVLCVVSVCVCTCVFMYALCFLRCVVCAVLCVLGFVVWVYGAL